MKAPREAGVLAACLMLLKARGVFHWRSNAAPIPLKNGGYRRFAGMRGVADILAVLGPHKEHPGGRLLAIETKSATGRTTPDQDAFLAAVERLGGKTLVCRDVLELQRLLDEVLPK